MYCMYSTSEGDWHRCAFEDTNRAAIYYCTVPLTTVYTVQDELHRRGMTNSTAQTNKQTHKQTQDPPITLHVVQSEI
jgi:hypothetical protein